MNVRQLIAELQKMPPDLEVRLWDEDEDDFMPVAQVLYEDGTSSVDLLTEGQAVTLASDIPNTRG